MMLKSFSKKQLNQISYFDHSKDNSPFLNIFLYLTQAQPEKIQSLFQFLRKYNIKLGFLTKEKRFSFNKDFYINANFIAQSLQPISEKDFATISSFLSSQVIIVSISYQNQMWTVSRFLKWHKISFQKALISPDVSESRRLDPQDHLIKVNNNQFVPLWRFFNHMLF